MALNNVQAVGDDQIWKAEVERQIEALLKRIAILERNSGKR